MSRAAMTPLETMEFYEDDVVEEDGKLPNVHLNAEDFTFALEGFRELVREAYALRQELEKVTTSKVEDLADAKSVVLAAHKRMTFPNVTMKDLQNDPIVYAINKVVDTGARALIEDIVKAAQEVSESCFCLLKENGEPTEDLARLRRIIKDFYAGRLPESLKPKATKLDEILTKAAMRAKND